MIRGCSRMNRQGVEGGRSIIDMGNMPVMITPNEYRDGIIRSMQ